MSTSDRNLRTLARMHGIQLNYRDVGKKLQTAAGPTLRRLLAVLGADVASDGDVKDALRSRRLQAWRRVAEPVVVAWDGRLTLRLRIPADNGQDRYTLAIEPESGERFDAQGSLDELSTLRAATVEGETFLVKEFALPRPLAPGYFDLTLTIAGSGSALPAYQLRVISAPQISWQTHAGIRERLWGVFAPLYALHSRQSWGGGDLTDLERLMDWLKSCGGDLVATLPLLASQTDFTDDPSPYSPTSRQFWNEFYLDVGRIPELEQLPALKQKLQSADFQSQLNSLRESRYVDYRHEMQLKRGALEAIADEFFRRNPNGTAELDEFILREPEVESYARHRAVCERLGSLWPDWPEPLRSGTIAADDYDASAFQYHLFAQWQVHRQLDAVAEQARQNEMVWYLDFPLGVNSHGYDVWKHRRLFATGASVGAPPDAFFTKGQNWGLPPLHPEKLRDDGYRYLIGAFRHHLRYAKLLRIDHIMGLHRLYWIPDGSPPKEGAYVRYNMDELFAVLSLESHRHQAVIIGENLGTVPDVVNQAMNRHGIGDMYVVQYETQEGNDPLLRPVPRGSVASLNTHDMPSFAAFWTALDVDERVDLDLMDDDEAAREREQRARLRRQIVEYLIEQGELTEPTRDPLAIQRAMLAHLGAGDAQVVFATLEDLWQETEPQNTPGTFKERRNWQRKTRFALEEFTTLPDVLRLLAELKRARDEGREMRDEG